MTLERYYNFIITFVLMMIFAAEYPEWAEIIGNLLLVYIVIFILSFLTEILRDFHKVIVFERGGVRIEKSSDREETQ